MANLSDKQERLGLTSFIEDNLSEWTSFTPTFQNTPPTLSVTEGQIKRVGDSVEISISLLCSATGSPSGDLEIDMPNGLTADSSKLVNAVGGYVAHGFAAYRQISPANGMEVGNVVVTGSNTLKSILPGSGAFTTWSDISSAGETYSLTVTVPVTEYAGAQNSLVGFGNAAATQSGLLQRYVDWTSVPFNAGDYTADTGTWTVASADIVTFRYSVINNSMHLNIDIRNTDISGSPNWLKIAVPGGYTLGADTSQGACIVENNAGDFPGLFLASNTDDKIWIRRMTPPWINSTGNNDIFINATIEIE